MALPAGIDTVTVTGTYMTTSGTTCVGTVTFVPDACEIKFGDIPVIVTGSTVAIVGTDGTFTATLVASDAAGADPTGFAYTIVENLSCLPCERARTLLLPAAGSPYNIADMPEEGRYVAA